MKTKATQILTSTVALACAVLTASANTFDFYKLGRGAGDFLPSGPYFTEGGDNVSSDIIAGTYNGSLVFTQGSITATATATYNAAAAAVVQDNTSNWSLDGSRTRGAGLGVYQDRAPNAVVRSDDNITNGEILTITFNQQVRLTTIVLNDDGHYIFSQNNPFTYSLNGTSTALYGTTLVNMIGTQFTFAYGGTNAHQFYLSSLTVSTVPDSGYTVGLMGAALLGFAAFRRRFIS